MRISIGISRDKAVEVFKTALKQAEAAEAVDYSLDFTIPAIDNYSGKPVEIAVTNDDMEHSEVADKIIVEVEPDA